MNVVDTVPWFLERYQDDLSFLKAYHAAFPDIFREYFAYHCADTEERRLQALARYPERLPAIAAVHRVLPSLLQETAEAYEERYGIAFPIDVNLIVGGFGSNAYATRRIVPHLTFALEQLPEERDGLRVLAAHEFGHVAQNLLTNRAGMDWQAMPWTDPLIWLNQEGAAIHFSRQIAPGLRPSVYFSFNGDGEDWLTFAENHRDEILTAFAEDYRKYESSRAQFRREWFSIRGGERFGYSRLGYYNGDLWFQGQVERLGEAAAVVAWRDPTFVEQARDWLHAACIRRE